jgi:hypothetical protein
MIDLIIERDAAVARVVNVGPRPPAAETQYVHCSESGDKLVIVPRIGSDRVELSPLSFALSAVKASLVI